MLEQDKNKIEQNIFSENIQIATETLLDITFNSDDWEWVQNICIALINNSENEDLRGLAVTCIGHLARIHGEINKAKVLPILRSLTNNSTLSGRSEDALDDIEQFT